MKEQKELISSNPGLDETSLRYMLRLAWPMIVTSVSFTIMQFVDTRMVAELGTAQLAAIMPASIMSFIPSSFALGVMTIVNTFVSQSLGKGQTKECSNYCWQVIYLGLVYAILILIFIWPSAPLIFKAIGQPAEIIPMEVIYLRIMLYAQFILVFIWACNQFFMGIHRPIIIMYSALIGQLVNVAANYALIFGKFGFPAMGIKGAAWGTFIGLSIGAFIRMFYFLTGDVNAKFQSRKSFKIDFHKMLGIIKFGFPAGFSLMINIAFWTVILFGLVGRFGQAPLAATSAVWSCIRLSFMPVIGVGTALTAAVGKSIGKENKQTAIKQTAISLKVAVTYMVSMGICFFVFRKSIMHFWSPDPDVIRIGTKILVCAAIFQLFDAILIIYGDALRGAGDTFFLAIMEITAAAVFLGLGGLFMVKCFPQLGALGPWIAAVVKIVFGAVANTWRFKTNKWMNIDIFKHRPVGVAPQIEATID